MSEKKDMTGLERPHFVVLRETEPVGSRKKTAYLCLCECGNTFITTGEHIRSGHTTSCGCQKKKIAGEINKTHGCLPKRLHRIWLNMKVRSGEIAPKSREKSCQTYIDKNIQLECEAWKEFEPFRDWALDNGYADGLTLDRADNKRGYSPENCRWVDMVTQSGNRDNTVRLTSGEPLSVVCKRFGVPSTHANGKSSALYGRILRRYKETGSLLELLIAAEEYVGTMRQCLELIRLLDDVRAFKAQYLNH